MALARRDVIAHGLTAAAALGLARPAEAAPAGGTQVATSRSAGAMELALLAHAPSTPTGLAISRSGRLFVMMPRFDAKVPITVGEVAQDGSVLPYPSEAANRPDPTNPQTSLLHVPNGVFDRDDTLWLLDAGLPEGKGPPVPGGAKLVQVDLAENRIRRIVPLESGITPSSSLNDLRVDIREGRAVAYITDQGQGEEGAILAVDLRSGRVVRRLQGHASTRSQKNLVKFVEHQPVMLRPEGGPEKPVQGGANGIALSPDGGRLYYAPLIGRRLYAVDAASLLDPDATDAEVAAGVEDLGEKGMTGGLTTDAEDRVYLTLQEQNAVARRHPDGRIEVIASDERLIWADTFWITPDRWLYVSAAQVNRRPEYNGGADLQKPPYAILRVRIDADPAG
ncbi:sugar lactone lactonase YvrE [Methylobacterium sp. BE186]|uniref:SMP-30/gluconolactonase/LRE family protein n=1 Tax=Methylobacterium sp. BE186 TaxID=2817715 RepID=UPI0028573D48|nr:L-dopachrome tautomerase-related protein [Methylobacterium sp. BE186]MDR7037479.1 sugar lactone lactonase YvrE [Methylobacterium sp. BE186]